MQAVRAAIAEAHPLAKAEFTTNRERLIKIGARVIEHIARIRVHLPTSCPGWALFGTVAFGLMPAGPSALQAAADHGRSAPSALREESRPHRSSRTERPTAAAASHAKDVVLMHRSRLWRRGRDSLRSIQH
jgi:Transposase DDE domain group 1